MMFAGVETRWPDSRLASWKLGAKCGVCRRETYEDQDAQILNLGSGLAAKLDTLPQTDYSALSIKSLADGEGDTFWYDFHAQSDRNSGHPASLNHDKFGGGGECRAL